MGIFERVGRGRQVVSEIIGRTAARAVAQARNMYVWLTVDRTQVDYAFWDRLRRGKEPTYKLGGLFAKPIVHHMVAWSLGKRFTAQTDHAGTDDALDMFIRKNIMTLVRTAKDSIGLGDSYIVVNADGTLTQVPPNQVEVVTDELDYTDVLAYRITTRLEKATIIDEYRADGRTLTVKRKTGLATATEDVTEFRNLTGRIPVIHWANEKSANELYGHPVFESLLDLFAEYDDTMKNSLAGVKAMSNPKPVLEKVESPEDEIRLISTGSESYKDADGVTQTAYQVDMAALEMIATTGEFNLKSPAPFTGDSWRMMKALFYLMLQHTNIPEWVWGGHIESSNASVDAQLPAWTLFVDLLRLAFEEPIVKLMETWLATMALFTPGIRSDLEIDITWPPLTDVDREVRLKEVQFARMDGLLNREDGLTLLNMVKDAAGTVERAAAEAEEEADAFDQSVETEIQRMRDEMNGQAGEKQEEAA